MLPLSNQLKGSCEIPNLYTQQVGEVTAGTQGGKFEESIRPIICFLLIESGRAATGGISP